MKFIPFAILFVVSVLELACSSDKGKNIQAPISENIEICDTSAIISYSAQIAVIINDNCISCHGPFDATKLNNYNNVRTYALASSGSVYSSVSNDGTAIPMPPGRPLSGCDIEKIKKWTNAGAPNN